VLQLWEKSDLTFRNRYQDDLLFVATSDGCGDQDSNRILAYSVHSFDEVWEFNADGVHRVGPGRKLLLDYASNTLYCVTDTPNNQSAVWALDSLTGILKWSVNLGRSSFWGPILANGALYVADAAGILYKLNAANGQEIWNYQASGPIPYDIAA